MQPSLMIHLDDADELEHATEQKSGNVRLKFGGVMGYLTIWLSPELAERVRHAIENELIPFEAGTFDRTSELGGELDQDLGER